LLASTAKNITTPSGSKAVLGIRILFSNRCNLALVEFGRLVKHAGPETAIFGAGFARSKAPKTRFFSRLQVAIHHNFKHLGKALIASP
jgi:hypothetical protein